MNQNEYESNIKYQELLILAYFTTHYKTYAFEEIAKLMGMTYLKVKESIDYLLELKMLILVDQYIVISKNGEKILKEYELEHFFVTKKEKIIKKNKWSIEKPYIPISFSV